MATIEEMITQLQHEVTVLQDRDRDHDHHISLAYRIALHVRVCCVVHAVAVICSTLFPFLALSAQTIMTTWAQIAQPGGKHSMQFRRYNA